MEDLLNFLVKAIVEKPEKISIASREEDGVTSISFSVDQEDMGRVIGRSGATIKALRRVMRIKALKEGKHINLDLTPQQ